MLTSMLLTRVAGNYGHTLAGELQQRLGGPAAIHALDPGSPASLAGVPRAGFHFPSRIRRKPEKFPVPGTIRDWKPLEFPGKFRPNLNFLKKFV